ncbi:MAG: GNAT family N-acetyltransferase [Halanaerobium sp.]|nr:GNAT family N-acetyltransferase [Halanaerobium sp.]
MDYQIRKAVPGDARALGELHSAAWRKAYKGIVPEEILSRINPDKREEMFRQTITSETEDTTVITFRGKVIGFITLGPFRGEESGGPNGEIWGIYISPSHWHQGLGTTLFNWGVKELTLRGYRQVFLWVLEDNTQARNFYQKLGFAEDGRTKEIEMGKTLSVLRYRKQI